MSNYTFSTATRDEVKSIILANHYAHRMPMVQHAFKITDGDTIVGIITFGIPASRALVVGVAGVENAEHVVELNRLWTVDNLPRNTLSEFVAHALRSIGDKIVVSYSDKGMHHNGYIYQATNFKFTGQTKLRTDVYTGEGKHSRHYDKSKTNRRIVRSPKNRYVIVVGNKRFKKAMYKALNYPILPYPKGDNQNYKVGDSKPEVVFDRNETTLEEVLEKENL